MSDRVSCHAVPGWGGRLRAAAASCRPHPRRLLLVGLLTSALMATIVQTPRPHLVWNVSASAPLGLYAIGSRDEIVTGDMVLARMPERWRSLAAARRYIPVNVPLVKRVAAGAGDTVCARGQEIFVNGRWIAKRWWNDGKGRPMPWWSGCVTLQNGALFLLMESSDSFDGRYFGPTAPDDIIGKARLVWAS